MSAKTVVTLVDDIDGSEASRSIEFSVDGQAYVIDLNDEHAHAFEQAIAPFVAAARKPRGRARGRAEPARLDQTGSVPTPTELREWARAHGHPVPERGRLSRHVRYAYDASH